MSHDLVTNSLNQFIRKPLLDYLVEQHVIDNHQYKILSLEQAKSGHKLNQLMTDLHIISSDEWAYVLSKYTGADVFDPQVHVVDIDLARQVPKHQLETLQIIPINITGDKLYAITIDPEDVPAFDTILKHFSPSLMLIPLIITEAHFNKIIDGLYNPNSVADILNNMILAPLMALKHHSAQHQSHSYPSFDAIEFVDQEIIQAVKTRSSDIHFEPGAHMVHVRRRIDGILQLSASTHASHWSAICVRIKIMAGMDIAESRLPQDGRFNLKIAGRFIDFRVAVHPTLHGENIVIRILDRLHALKSLGDLGFDDHQLNILKSLIQLPYGLMILAGPTGSGKTTTLYGLLNYISSVSVNIMTLEDPVEYELQNIRQTEVNELNGVSFATGVRSILRQDPDVILIGEVRDADTAQMAFRAAMTGHLVLTTLHANDSFSAIYRLMDLGVSPAIIANNLVGIVSQRLIRLSCSCQRDDANHLPSPCHGCQQTGFKGRQAIGEILMIDDDLQDMIVAQKSLLDLKRYAQSNDFVDIKAIAEQRLQQGLTNRSEIQRVVGAF